MTYFLDFELTEEESTKRWTIVGMSPRRIEKPWFYSMAIRRHSEPDKWVFRFPSQERAVNQVLAVLNNGGFLDMAA